jgi:cbb3-type cytochrome oxidase maturation protein
MSVMFLVLPVALVMVLLALAAFRWAAREGQFDDLETPAIRALDDDEARPEPPPTPLKVAEGSFRVMSETTYFRRTLVRVLIVQALTLLVLGWLHWTFGR